MFGRCNNFFENTVYRHLFGPPHTGSNVIFVIALLLHSNIYLPFEVSIFLVMRLAPFKVRHAVDLGIFWTNNLIKWECWQVNVVTWSINSAQSQSFGRALFFCSNVISNRKNCFHRPLHQWAASGLSRNYQHLQKRGLVSHNKLLKKLTMISFSRHYLTLTITPDISLELDIQQSLVPYNVTCNLFLTQCTNHPLV